MSAGVVAVALLQRRDAREAARAAARAAEAAESSVRLQREMHDEQTRLSIYPPLVIEFPAAENTVDLELSNPSAVAALDVDLLVIGAMYEQDVDFEEFIDLHVTPKYQEERRAIGMTDDGSFGMYDHLSYTSVPPRSAVTAPLSFPLLPVQLIVLFQYRDMLGRNYRHVVLGMLGEDRYSKSYDYERLTELVRVDPLWRDPIPPPDADPELEGFYDLFAHSVSIGMLKDLPRGGVEDRGDWSALS